MTSATPGPCSPAADRVRVLVVDDSTVVRSGLLSLLELDERIVVVGEAGDGAEALQKARALEPDVVLLDVQMPRRDGLSVAQELAAGSRVLMLTFSDTQEAVHAAVAAGAVGYLVHGTFAELELVSCVLAAAAGTAVFGPSALAALRAGPSGAAPAAPSSGRPAGLERHLSRRQVEIMDLVAAGRSNTQIGRELFLAEKTVKNHINHIFARLGVRSRAEAVSLWLGGTTQARLDAL